MFFPEKYIRKQVKKGLSREEVWSKFRESDRHKVMKGKIPIAILTFITKCFHISDLYQYRVLRDGTGDLDYRARLFTLAFRVKLNNWWSKNAQKIIEKYIA